MELNFRIFNYEGIIIPINIEKEVMPIPLSYNDSTAQFYYNSSKKGIMWNYNEKEIVKKSKSGNVFGRPTTDFKYIVTVYTGINEENNPPQNCVIYNLDGSIHRILEIPVLKSPLAIKRLEFLNEENPPKYVADFVANFGYPINFCGCGWDRLDNGKIVNFIAIDYDRELWETRVLDPETGKIGDLIHYDKN